MATLILVHGTFASGPEDGDRWWQRGSAFDDHMQQLLAAEQGDLAVERFVWDGNNSVSSRRAAGTALYRRMIELEKAERPYCIVGHSHGGSVIAAALMRAALARRSLQHLKRWITVGTPFVVPLKDRFLFTRLNRLGQAVLVAIITFALSATVASFSSFHDPGALAAAIGTVAIAPLLLVYLILWLIDRRRNGHFRSRVLARFDESFSPRWFGLWHRDDEAICGLAALGSADRPIFNRGFAVPALSMLAIVLFPVLIYIVLSSQDLAQWLLSHHLRTFGTEKLKGIVEASGALKGAGKDLGTNFVLLLTTGGEAFTLVFPGSATTARAVFLIAIVPVTALLLSLIVLWLVTYAAKPVSFVLSRLLNATTWAQLRERGFGGDVQGERAVEARTIPVGCSRSCAPLPDDLASELSAASDAAAAKSIPRLRGAINAIAFAKGDSEQRALAEYFTWNELIHTSYFDVPGVRRLIAYAVAEADGFKSSDILRGDPDYVRVGTWYRMLDGASPDGQQTKVTAPGS